MSVAKGLPVWKLESNPPMKAQLLSLFVLAVPLVMNLASSEANSDEMREPRPAESTAGSGSRGGASRDAKHESRGDAARVPEQRDAEKPPAKRPKKAPAGRDYLFM